MTRTEMNQVIDEFAARGALFVVNHSGGKDSMATFNVIADRVPQSQIVVIHATLPGAEWEGTAEKAREYTKDRGYDYIETRNRSKTFFEMVRHRQMWPSPQYRQCTSDLKRNPIEREIRHYLKAHPEFNGLIVNCMGLRAEESASRAKQIPLKRGGKDQNAAGREWWNLLPIHEWTEDEVWADIAAHGQTRHWAYDKGMTRLSCCFCIMASAKDLRTAATLNPELYREYVALEREIDQTFVMPVKGVRRWLPEVTGVPA